MCQICFEVEREVIEKEVIDKEMFVSVEVVKVVIDEKAVQSCAVKRQIKAKTTKTNSKTLTDTAYLSDCEYIDVGLERELDLTFHFCSDEKFKLKWIKLTEQ